MENENVVEFNIGKGILFALAGAIVGCVVWLAVIALSGWGTGGAVGGALAAVLGMLVAGAYQKGQGKSGIVGIILVALITFAAAAVAFIFGLSIYLYNEGIGNGVFDALDRIFDLLGNDTRFTSAFIQDFAISIGASVVVAIATMVGKKKDKEAETD